MHGTPGPVTSPLFNQCQHGTIQFLSWHRGYVYFFERILRMASGDPSLTLPYWDWTTAPALPAAFRSPADASNPLFDDTRNLNNGAQLPPSVVVDDLNTALAFIDFETPASTGFSPSLEGSPHGAVHVLIGGNMSSDSHRGQRPDLLDAPLQHRSALESLAGSGRRPDHSDRLFVPGSALLVCRREWPDRDGEGLRHPHLGRPGIPLRCHSQPFGRACRPRRRSPRAGRSRPGRSHGQADAGRLVGTPAPDQRHGSAPTPSPWASSPRWSSWQSPPREAGRSSRPSPRPDRPATGSRSSRSAASRSPRPRTSPTRSS